MCTSNNSELLESWIVEGRAVARGHKFNWRERTEKQQIAG